MSLIKHFIEGKPFEGSSKRTGRVFNPATGEETSKVILASKADVDLAVQKAKKAFREWSNKPPVIRARVLFKFKELIEKNSDELTKIIVSEHGKVYEDAKGSLNRGLEVVEYACGIPQVNSTTSSPLINEPFASSYTLPCSETIILVNSSEFFSINSLNLNTIFAL